jgi:hypothetical protein
MTTRIKLRRDTAQNWLDANPILAAGEPGLETDTGKIKYGDGVTAYALLPHAGGDTLTDEGNVVVTAGSTEHWIATQRRDGYDTEPRSLRYDSEGNLYVLTNTYEAQDNIAVITKYTADGAVSWQKTFSQTEPLSLAVDSSDCAYITMSDGDPETTVIKFSTAGAILWKKSYDIGPTAALNAYIEEKSSTTLALVFTGETGEIQGSNIVVAMEISGTDGTVQIKKQISFADEDQRVYATGIDVDSDENVFVTGYYYDAEDSKNKMFIEKLDEDLDRVWTKSIDSDNNYDMYGGDCASDAQGNIYAVGTYDVLTTNSNVDEEPYATAGILVKLNSSGVVQWTRRIGPGPCGSFIAGLTATDVGDVYLSAVTFVNNTQGPLAEADEWQQEGYGVNKMIVARYNTQGAVIWQRYVDVTNLYESDNDEYDRGQAVAVYNNKFAVGGYGYSYNTTPFSYASSDDNEADYFVVQLPTDGTDLTIGNLNFTASRVPGRFITLTATDSPLVIESYAETVLAETNNVTADTEPRIANNTVKSETYDYVFGADGTLTIPNDGDIRLTQTQVGYLVALGGSDNNDDNIYSRATTVDSRGNMYVVGNEDDDNQPFVTKISPEGVRLWGMSLEEDNNGHSGRANGVTIHPTTGNLMVVCEFYGTYTYSVLFDIDHDTGRILDHDKFSDSDADVYLNDIAYTSSGTHVMAGSKNGEFSPEIPVTAITTASTTGTIVFLRSDLPANLEASTNWQIGGTGFSVFENLAYVERYTGLTGTVRQGSGATFDIINNGNGTYSAGISTSTISTNYLPGHKIKILGTSLGGATPDNDCVLTVATAEAGAITLVTNTGTAASTTSGTTYLITTDFNSAVTNAMAGDVRITSPSPTMLNKMNSIQPYVDSIEFITAESETITAFITSAFTFDGTSWNATYFSSNFGPYVINTITFITAGTATYTAVSGTNTDVGSGFTVTFEGPRSSNLYAEYNNYNITNVGSNYVENDIIVIPGTSLGGTSPANDLTWTAYAPGGSVTSHYNLAGTSQTSTWKLETTTQVNFASTGSWTITYPLSRENLLITPTWTRTFGTSGNTEDRLYAVSVDSANNIITVGQGYGQLAEDNNDNLAMVYKFSPTGTLEWARRLNDENDDCYAKSVATIGTDIYVTHQNDSSETVITKLDASGTVKWQRITESGDDSVIARTVDGNLLVTCEGYYEEIDDTALKVFMMTPSGEIVYKRWLLATTDNDTEFKNGRCLAVDSDSFYITGYFDANSYDSSMAARLPIDGSGTGEHGSFRYMDVNPMTSSFMEDGLSSDTNYSVNTVDLDDVNNYAGPLSEGETVNVNTGTTVTVGEGDFYIDSYYPDLTVETVRDTDGGNIVFADGSTQNTSATDWPQRRFTGQKYTLGLKDRGHHIYVTDTNDSIVIPYNARVEFPIGTVIHVVNGTSGSFGIFGEGGSINIQVAGTDDQVGDTGGAFIGQYAVATVLKVDRDSWVIFGPGVFTGP